MKPFTTLINCLGRYAINVTKETGRFGVLFGEAVANIFLPPFRYKLYIEQLMFIGNKSLTVVALTGGFTGMVLALQMFETLKQFSSESIVGGVVALAMVKELGPVLTALMVNSRAGSSIAAQLGTMCVTEQIDALRSMAVNPVQYLISPRIFAGLVMLPILTIISNVIGVVGGYIVAVSLLGLDAGLYVNKVTDLVGLSDIWGGLYKSAAFGVTLSFVGCYFGYYTTGGAKGVGLATTGAVVTSSVLILSLDFIITSFLIAV